MKTTSKKFFSAALTFGFIFLAFLKPVSAFENISNAAAEQNNYCCTDQERGTGPINGMAIFPDGSAIQRAKVTAHNTRTLQTKTLYSDAYGQFSFTEMPVGDIYVIDIDHKQILFSNNTRTIQHMGESLGVLFVADGFF